ncbi:MAG: acid sugar phosphatase [Chloroflexota bacterium]|nr:MAG: acid sugar phosphatase [Chloroflexota bacterium]
MMSDNLAKLAEIRLFLLDMDGTVYLGDKLLPGAVEFIELLAAHDINYLFLTNNSSKHRGQYAEKLAHFGLAVSPEKIFTSGEATAIYLQQAKAGAKIYLVGTPALEDEFRDHGFKLVDAETPDYAVLGFDTTLTYHKLWRLCDLVRAGVPYIATHPDFNCPIPGGFMPDIGAMMALVEASTGRRPDVIIGKPNPPMIAAVVERTATPVDKICMVGDRLYTDIALAAAGVTTVLVLSGETQPEDIPGAPYSPDFVMQDLGELAAALQEAAMANRKVE